MHFKMDLLCWDAMSSLMRMPLKILFLPELVAMKSYLDVKMYTTACLTSFANFLFLKCI